MLFQKRKNLLNKILVIIGIASIIFYNFPADRVLAATYTFTQNDWSGGASVNTATSLNLNGWTNYNLASSSLTTSIPGQISLATTSSSTVVSGSGFNSGIYADTTLSGSSIVLQPNIVANEFGSGVDGSITISTTTNINTTNIESGRNCADGGDAVSYNVTGLTTNTATFSSAPSAGCLAPNDKILLINLQGAGTSLMTNVGNYEFLTIQSVSGNVVTFTTNKTKYYGNGVSDDTNIGTASTNQRVIMQRVPQYSNVTINNGVTLTASAWNGIKGGVLAFYANGTVTVGGNISMKGAGYRPNNSYYGYPGESRPGTSNGISNAMNNNDGGGGGGGWDNYNYIEVLGSGGGYGTAGANHTSGDGTTLGGISYGGSDLSSQIFLGSAGGTYDAANYPGFGGDNCTNSRNNLGGSGGGIIFIKGNSISVSGVINGDGGNAVCNAAGNGSGGSIYLEGNSMTLGSNLVTAAQGTGGTAAGTGRIYIKYSSLSGTTNPTALTSLVPYLASGTYTSNAIVFPPSNYTTLNYSATIPVNTSLSVNIRAGDTNNPGDSTWTAWQIGVGSGANISSLSGHQYFQYQVNFSTTDTSVTPSLSSITIGYQIYDVAGNLISSAYDTGNSTNLMGYLGWDDNATLPAGTGVTVSLKTASTSAGLANATWYDFTESTASCSKVSTTVSCPSTALPSIFKQSGVNEWFQYKVALTSTGAFTPIISDVIVKYVINAPPQFDGTFGTNGITVSQDATSTDASWGKVVMQFHIKDPDTTTGTINPGYVTPTFQYNTGSGWQNISSSTIQIFDQNNNLITGNLAVSENSFTPYTAIWDAKTQIPGVNTSNAQVMITLNDNEAANNTAQATSSSFVLDTTPPTVSGTIDAGDGIMALNISDTNNVSYNISNNGNFSADGVNTISGQWQATGTTTISNATTSWIVNASSTYPTVYLEARDAYGNTASTTMTAPSAPGDLYFKDLSNPPINAFREFISWTVYTPTSTAPFNAYEIYRSIDGTNYSLYMTISSITTNYYLDQGLASTTMYYYKVKTVDTTGDASQFSSVVNDTPDGKGGTNNVPPTISGVILPTGDNLQNTWAKITWTTDTLSNSTVEYGTSTGNYTSSTTVDSMVTSHSVVISGLTPNTAYYFKVDSADAAANEASSDNNGAGYAFTTKGGPIISQVNVVPAETGATIIWNTNIDSNSYVDYSTDSGLSSPVEIGSASLVGGATSSSSTVFQHSVALSGLNYGTTYYFQVKSTDASSNTSIDANNGNYYSFTTLHDVIPPKISNIETPIISSNSAVITWQTDKLSTSQVAYGDSTSTLTNITQVDPILTIYHIVTLSQLTANKAYYFTVSSQDAATNATTSDFQTFTTPKEGQVQVITVTNTAASTGQNSTPDTTPPVISQIKVSSTTSFTATISFETDKPTVGFIDYGTSTSYGLSGGDSAWSQSHTIQLNGLTMGTDYHFKLKAIDKSNNVGNSDDQKFTTQYFAEELNNLKLKTINNAYQFQQEVENSIESVLPSLLPPFIEKPEVADVTENSATIKWITNISSYSVVDYATDGDYNNAASSTASTTNPYNNEASDLTTKSVDHQITLTGLKSDTQYHFMVKSFSLPQVVGKGNDMTFVTLAPKVRANVTDIKVDSFRVIWSTAEPANSIIEYKNLSTGEINRQTDNNMETYHDMVISNLTPGTTYTVKVMGYNAKNNLMEAENEITVTTSRDTTPPKITDFKVDNALVPGTSDRIQTIVSWKTDKPSNSTVYYVEGASPANGEFPNKVEVADSYVMSHDVILTDLKPGVIYQIKIISVDTSGNKASFGPRTIITPQQAQSIFDIIFKNFQDTFQFLRNTGQ